VVEGNTKYNVNEAEGEEDYEEEVLSSVLIRFMYSEASFLIKNT